MKKNIVFCTLILFGLLFTAASFATVKLPAIVSSNMVLQRNTTITLWGWADAEEKIRINASWLSEELNIVADSEGNWRVDVKTTNSKAPQAIKINSSESDILLDNILFGEVWLCSGQSNMTQPIKGYVGQPTYGSQQAMIGAKNENLRLFTVELNATTSPLKDVEKYRGWQSASTESVKNFSAIAYFFGQQLQETLDVPVGMIHTSWGGSLVEAWISNDVLGVMQEVDLSKVDLKRGNRFPTVLYNAMINPLIPYTIKGALWYQGESNASEPKKYTELFPAMVKDWRDRWGIGEFPFYYAQIAPYIYGGNDAFADAANTAFIREAQLQCLDLIPNSGIAITMDIGKADYIHPPKKKEVADRLLYNALNQTYGIESMDFSGPIFDTSEINEEGILLKFKHAENGLYTHEKLEGFEIAGADKVFYPATARISGGRNVLVKSDKVEKPVAVRYAWRNWVVGTLFDTNLLPASSFRTDNWADATLFKK
jgi:sialate O-acetylesterase